MKFFKTCIILDVFHYKLYAHTVDMTVLRSAVADLGPKIRPCMHLYIFVAQKRKFTARINKCAYFAHIILHFTDTTT